MHCKEICERTFAYNALQLNEKCREKIPFTTKKLKEGPLRCHPLSRGNTRLIECCQQSRELFTIKVRSSHVSHLALCSSFCLRISIPYLFSMHIFEKRGDLTKEKKIGGKETIGIENSFEEVANRFPYSLKEPTNPHSSNLLLRSERTYLAKK